MGLGTNWKERLSGQANAKPLISCENEFHLLIKKNLFFIKGTCSRLNTEVKATHRGLAYWIKNNNNKKRANK